MPDPIADLMAAPLSEFVARRKEIATSLRKSGDGDAAQRILATRKPSLALWTANQAARQNPESAEVLLDAAAGVESAQGAALSGQPGAAARLRTASAAFQQALDGLLQRAGDTRQMDEAARRRVRGILQAAALGSAADRAALAGGHLVEEPPPLGFGGLAGFTVLQGGAAAAPPSGGDDLPESAPEATERERARQAAEENTRRLVALREAAQRADAEAANAEAQAGRLEGAAIAADEEARRRRREAEAARRQATELRSNATEAQAALDSLSDGSRG